MNFTVGRNQDMEENGINQEFYDLPYRLIATQASRVNGFLHPYTISYTVCNRTTDRAGKFKSSYY